MTRPVATILLVLAVCAAILGSVVAVAVAVALAALFQIYMDGSSGGLG